VARSIRVLHLEHPGTFHLVTTEGPPGAFRIIWTTPLNKIALQLLPPQKTPFMFVDSPASTSDHLHRVKDASQSLQEIGAQSPCQLHMLQEQSPMAPQNACSL
jgi:hypothetical protein